MTLALVTMPLPFSALVGRQNCTFLAVACVNLKLLARVSGVSPWWHGLQKIQAGQGPRGWTGWRAWTVTVACSAGGGAAARKVTYLPQYLTFSVLSDVRNDVVTLGLRCQYILILSPISALMSATISVYPDIVSDISSYVSYDIRDVPDIVGGKNRVGF
jgi:hypothetical protein